MPKFNSKNHSNYQALVDSSNSQMGKADLHPLIGLLLTINSKNLVLDYSILKDSD